MNFFYLIKHENKKLELLTAKLDGTILPGVTRQSVIDLCNDWGVTVTERYISITEFVELYKNGQVKEAFCTGTAANIAPVKSITYKNEKMELLKDDQDIGEFANKLYTTLTNIQYGIIENHRFQRRLI